MKNIRKYMMAAACMTAAAIMYFRMFFIVFAF